MAENLVIVESPAKAKTIAKFLGKQYEVRASMGHVRDLPKSKMGIDTENDFTPSYSIPADKRKTITELKGKIKANTNIWIATDEDREGEAIGWHLLEALKINPKKHDVKRIVFHEITKNAILKSIETPRDIDQSLVDAQQTRRILDRLVGYELSPLLWKKIRYGLSAGRVQSVAVRLIVEREREIEAFKPEEYWDLSGLFIGDAKEKFEAQLAYIKSKKAVIGNQKSSDEILKDLKGADYKVTKVEEKDAKRNPAPPFITSTLQQEASRKLGFSVKKTMMIAQQLYEGVDTGKETAGLITYMRTDSFNLSDLALAQAKTVIQNLYGKEYVNSSPRIYKKTKGAQEAHEAIRPTDLSVTPESIDKYLNKDQFRLYELIWKRTIACQMQEARLKNLIVEIESSIKGKGLPYVFKATGQTITFQGFMKVYVEGTDDEAEATIGPKEKLLPPLKEGESLKCEKLDSTQHFTKPPARYTEASLVKKLETEGIGRPSTYAPTIGTIIARGYVEKEQKVLKPTDTGMVVNDLLVEHFSQIVDYKFTANMEETLDKIAEGKVKWIPVLKEFYEPFHKNILEKEKSINRSDVVNEESDEVCEKCGNPMVIKLGRYGKFLSCSNYPDCKNAKPIVKEGAEEKSKMDKDLEKKLSGKKCDKCGEPMEIKTGRFGEFLGCSAYPKCKNIQAIVKFAGVSCPDCKEGQLIERRTRKAGKIFYGCNKFPKCKFATWDRPVEGKCTACGGMLVEKKEKIICNDCKAEQGALAAKKTKPPKESAKKTVKKIVKKSAKKK
ncbi:type I DNA topoisomerase [Patescibacteria group bacterium]|nr:type I DNA topoisomerase [Patescibacteria group bacterium]